MNKKFFHLCLMATQAIAAGWSFQAMAYNSENAMAANTEAATYADKWYDRSFEQLLKTKIITSTREEQEITQSPNIMSVYTAADIKIMGIRTLRELLERTPGFFINQQIAGPSLGSRGFIGDNEQFLVLIDGHSANSIVDKGPGNFYLFPFLEHVERIEILRGPGSTLWGSDAALGIIHIITKKGEEIGGIKATASSSSGDNMRYVNVQAGDKFTENVSYMLSLSMAKADGFPEEAVPFLSPKGRWNKLGESTDFYFKGEMGNITIYARSADMLNARPGGSIVANKLIWDIFNPDPAISGPAAQLYNLLQQEDYYIRRKHNFIDVQHKKSITETLESETRVFTDQIQGWLSQSNPTLSNGSPIIEESGSSSENALGIESLLRWQAHSRHNLLFGARVVQTEIEPVSNDLFYPATSSTSSFSPIRTMRVVPDSKDENIALFIEDSWQIINGLETVFGLRVDNNSLRESSTIVLPRFSLNWKINPDWIAQYSYTTGYIRPPVGIGFLGQAQYNTNLSSTPAGKIYGAQKSEEVFNHNLSLTYNQNPFNVKLSLYQTDIDNSFNFLYQQGTVAGEERILFYINTNNIEMRGSEVEFNFIPSETWNIYANLSYIFDSRLNKLTGSDFGVSYDLNTAAFGEGAFTKDGTVIGYPHQILNIGSNYFFTESFSGNLHYRGWRNMYARNRINITTVGTATERFGPENFLDLNLRYVNIANTRLDLGFFIKNVLDNDDSNINMLLYHRRWSEQGRSWGMEASYTF